MRGMVVSIFLHIRNFQQIEDGIGVAVEAGRMEGRAMASYLEQLGL